MDKKGIKKLNCGAGIGILRGFISIDKYLTKEQIIEGWKSKEGSCQAAVVELEDDGSYPEYITCDISKMPFPDGYFDYALLNNVLEHLPMHELQGAVTEVRRVLSPGGTICLIAPDFNGLATLWVNNIANKVGSFTDWDLFRYVAECVVGNQTHPGEFHLSPITPDLLNFLLELTGFEKIRVIGVPIHTKCPDYDGNRTDPESIVRCDTLIAYGYVPEPLPSELSICVQDGTKVACGLRQ